jgi:hypothetical protein
MNWFNSRLDIVREKFREVENHPQNNTFLLKCRLKTKDKKCKYYVQDEIIQLLKHRKEDLDEQKNVQ